LAAAAGHIRPGFELCDAVLPPLVLLHGLLPIKLLMADVALERPVIAMSALVDLKLINSSFKDDKYKPYKLFSLRKLSFECESILADFLNNNL
jgi:hypothetical protein